jgi:hypothetical protein
MPGVDSRLITMMDLSPGDWVQTDTGLKGQVVHVARLTAFVDVHFDGGNEILPFLLSELTRVDPPQEPGGPLGRQPYN